VVKKYFQLQTNKATVAFEFDLTQFVHIGTPAIQAMTCLEANLATTADVYVFYHAFFRSTLKMLKDSGMEYCIEVQREILLILDSRHNQLFGTGNLASKVYVSAAYLVLGECTK
jgi:hypothetical protein